MNEATMAWLEQRIKNSRTGISIDWVQANEVDPAGFRFMSYHKIGKPFSTIEDAISDAMK